MSCYRQDWNVKHIKFTYLHLPYLFFHSYSYSNSYSAVQQSKLNQLVHALQQRYFTFLLDPHLSPLPSCTPNSSQILHVSLPLYQRSLRLIMLSPPPHLVSTSYSTVQNWPQKFPPVFRLPQLPQAKLAVPNSHNTRWVHPYHSALFSRLGGKKSRFPPLKAQKTKQAEILHERELNSSLLRLNDPLGPGHISRRHRGS